MNTWKLSWHGLRTVVALELRQRIRSRRWLVALIAWFVLIGALTALIITVIPQMGSGSSEFQPGPIAFGLITYLILGLGLVIAPAFTATSINGDRAAGTLALLQATRLSALEIAFGKLLAALATALAFLLTALPFVIWSMVLGSISVWQVVVCFAVVFAEVAVVCAIGLGLSALMNRTAGSTVLTYLIVAIMTVLSPMVLVLSVQLTMRHDTVREWGLTSQANEEYLRQIDEYWSKNGEDASASGMPAPPFDQCTWTTRTYDRPHPEQVWWMIAANPFVVVADAAPLSPDAQGNLSPRGADPLSLVRYGVRAARNPQPSEVDSCSDLYSRVPGYDVHRDEYGNITGVTTTDGTPVPVTSPVKNQTISAGNPVWPWGLGVNVLLGAAFFVVAVLRLKVPYGVLPRGTRVA